jgi:hypothetical protein
MPRARVGKRGLVCFATLGFALAMACGRFSSSGLEPADGGADAASESDAISYFYCPAPAEHCKFSTQCCISQNDSGTYIGGCIGLEEQCPDSNISISRAFCDRRSQCQEALDASDAVCCLLNGSAFSCQRGSCGGNGVETCFPGAIPSECTDQSQHCTPFFLEYSLCQ